MHVLRQILTFFGVGVAATLADFGTRALVLELAGQRPAVCAMIGYIAGGCLSYALNRAHTFETSRSHAEAGWRFAAVMAVGFALTLFFVWLFTEGLGLPPSRARDYGAFIVTTGIVFFWNYAAHKLWTFAERKG